MNVSYVGMCVTDCVYDTLHTQTKTGTQMEHMSFLSKILQ